MRLTTLVMSLLIAGICYAQQPRQATLTQQKMCSGQARKFFLDPEMAQKNWTTYSSHYDVNSNVCYIMVRQDITIGSSRSIAFNVFDAFEGVERAWLQFDGIRSKTPSTCEVKPQGQKQIACNSDEEFDQLVMKYFGIERP